MWLESYLEQIDRVLVLVQQGLGPLFHSEHSNSPIPLILGLIDPVAFVQSLLSIVNDRKQGVALICLIDERLTQTLYP
jgi:hypothetical protein